MVPDFVLLKHLCYTHQSSLASSASHRSMSSRACLGGGGNSHYGGNSETYMDTAEAMGKTMIDLLAK